MTSLVKVQDKPSAEWDYGSTLEWLWISDKDRPPIYSRKQFARFWDIRYVEHRK